MYFERIYDEGLAAASYIIACQKTGEALIVDPLRDLDLYLNRVQELGYKITRVAETHIHADFLSGGRDLARATNATLYVSGEEGEGWEYKELDGLKTVALNDHDTFRMGGIHIEALHTPGHTPEHISYLVTDTAAADEPLMLLSGDFAFVGDLGRPDLLEKAAGESGTAQAGAEQLYESVKNQLLTLQDSVQIWPGHGSGSACGKALGALPSSTVGYERRNAWWGPFFENDDKEGFIEALLSGQPESPKYFKNMKIMNRDGVPGGDDLPALKELTPQGFQRLLNEEDAILLDVRPFEDFARNHMPGAINLPSVKAVSTHGGWVLPFDKPLIISTAPEHRDEVRRRLYRIGYTQLAGFIPRQEGYITETTSYPVLDPDQAAERLKNQNAQAVDVRSKNDFDTNHVNGAIHAHYGQITDHLDELPRDRELLLYCGSGARASVAISQLERAGFNNLINARGFDALNELGLAS